MTTSPITIPTLNFLNETFNDAVMSFGTYPDGGVGVYLDSAEGESLDVVSVNLAAHYGLVPEPGTVFVPNDKGDLLTALKTAGVVSPTGRTVTYGPFNSTASEVEVHAPR